MTARLVSSGVVSASRTARHRSSVPSARGDRVVQIPLEEPMEAADLVEIGFGERAIIARDASSLRGTPRRKPLQQDRIEADVGQQVDETDDEC